MRKIKKLQSGGDSTLPKPIQKKWIATVGDTAAVKKKADSLGLSTSKAKDALKARIAAKKQRSGGKTPAWQRKEGKSPSGGLNAKGRASLRAAGHDIKAPQPGGGPRKKSFCARMSGMKKKLTSAKTANDPNSRINKSLRKWNC